MRLLATVAAAAALAVLSPSVGPAQAQGAKPTCENYCPATCQRRIADGRTSAKSAGACTTECIRQNRGNPRGNCS